MEAALHTDAGAWPAPTRITILYDERCALCRRARDWLLSQACLVEVELLAAGSAEAHRRYDGLPWVGKELVAVDEHGNAWVGPAAFLVCMWATRRYRPWAFRLSRPSLAPRAEQFFRWVSRSRARWGATAANDCTWCAEEAAKHRRRRPVASGTLVTCTLGHRMSEAGNFCVLCGSPRAAVRVGSTTSR